MSYNGITLYGFWCARHCWSRRQNCCILVLVIGGFFFTYFRVLTLWLFCTCTLGDFDTVWHALVEVYINATGEFSVCMYVGWYVCMYTSIDIVSKCISFWGSPGGHDNGWLPVGTNRQQHDKTQGFETYTKCPTLFCVDEMQCFNFALSWKGKKHEKTEGFET